MLTSASTHHDWLIMEARSLLTRIRGIRSFSLNMTMVGAAMISPAAWKAIERHLEGVRREVYHQVRGYLGWLSGPSGCRVQPQEAQRIFSILKLRFNTVLDQLDIFADVLSQRSEHENGVWIAGLDVAARDALTLPGDFYKVPEMCCYLDRGHGAAIRRARTRLPGGKMNPVAVIRIPRERMVGSGIGSSLYHETGHQGAALLGLVTSMRQVLRERQRYGASLAWRYFERCISEILADFWAVARLGVTAAHGLMSVVSLPRWFVFRINMDDPHPFPWIRVKLSCAMGRALYPHPQWDRLERLWESLYPVEWLDRTRRETVSRLEASIPEFMDILAGHSPRSLKGKALRDIFPLKEFQPASLKEKYDNWLLSPSRMRAAPPSLAIAVIGQARADGRISPEKESRLISMLLSDWALNNMRRDGTRD